MALTQLQGLGLSNDWLAPGMLEDDPRVVQLASRFFFEPVAGDSARYALSLLLAPSGVVGYGPPPTPLTQSVPFNRSYAFGVLAESFTVNYATQDAQSNVNDQTVEQFGKALRRLLYGFWRQFIAGDPTVTPNEFQGLRAIINQPAFAGQIIDKGGAPLTTKDLSDAMRRIKSSDNFCVYCYTSGEGLTAIEEAFVARGVLPTPIHSLVPDGNGSQNLVTRSSVWGAELFWSDFVDIAPGPPPATEVWFMNIED